MLSQKSLSLNFGWGVLHLTLEAEVELKHVIPAVTRASACGSELWEHAQREPTQREHQCE
eukprot:3735296-Rhodomonas_salina.1